MNNESSQQKVQQQQDQELPQVTEKESESKPAQQTKSEEDKQATVLTSDDFVQWSDNTPLQLPSEQPMHGVKIGIKEAIVRGSGLMQHTTYNIVGEDQNGSFDVERRYSQFNCLRKKLNQRWPGIFIPVLPTKRMFGKNDEQLTKNRQRFLNEFLHKIANLPYLYKSEQVQVFLRHQGPDIVKALEKFTKPPVSLLLSKYQQAFAEHVDREDVLKQKQQIGQFRKFTQKTQQVIDDLKNHSRNLAESRDKYSKIVANVFAQILPRYEANTIIEFSEGSEAGSIFKSSQFSELDLGLFRSSTSNNPYWLLYDLLKFQQRETKGMKETIEDLHKLGQRREETIRKIVTNKEQIGELSQGKLTLRSLITPGTKEEIKVKLSHQNQQLQLQKQQLLKVINLATLKLSQQIEALKISKVRLYHQVIKKVYGTEMCNLEGALEYSRRLEEIAQRFIK